MKYISLLFAALMLLLHPSIRAESQSHSEMLCTPSILTIEAFDTSDQKTTILLDNGTLWSYDDTDLIDGQDGWQPGDRIRIVYVYLQGYFLQNDSYQGCVPVKLMNGLSREIKAVQIQEIVKNEKQSTYTLTLIDGSRWFVGSWSGSWMSDWQLGDRIIMTPQTFLFGKADYFLINLDRAESPHLPVNVRAQLLYSSNLVEGVDVNKREGKNWKMMISNIWKQGRSLMIELDNKTIWQCSSHKKNWKIGDEVVFDFDLENIKLQNVKRKEKLNASLVNHHSDGLQTQFIEAISQEKNKVTLTDGSVWSLGYQNAKKWREGDRVMVSPLGYLSADTSSHLLINLDQLHRKAAIPSYCYAALVR